jgi:hypothetical protein
VAVAGGIWVYLWYRREVRTVSNEK